MINDNQEVNILKQTCLNNKPIMHNLDPSIGTKLQAVPATL